ncbi:MAG: hypothetical protein EOL87_12685 [Spartobacteria bacterium]|nr:hypothetical protein [Spartobacteria bacterium]
MMQHQWISKNHLRLARLLPGIITLFSCGCFGDATVRDVRNLTKQRTKIVWTQQAEGDAKDVFGHASQLVLMGFDTGDKKGVRTICGQLSNYRRPMMTPDGEDVIYSDVTDTNIYTVAWEGGQPRMLAKGLALDVWKDPATGRFWVYAVEHMLSDVKKSSGNLFRFAMDDPSITEVVWANTTISPDNFQLSSDGLRAGGLFPWPAAGILNVKEKTPAIYGRGCWTSIAPDNTYLLWIFDGAHRNLTFLSEDKKRRWQVDISKIPEGGGFEVYHPRWSNHRRYFAVTGPYKMGTGENRIGSGGQDVEIFLGQFNETLTAVDHFVQITDNERLDITPDVWVDGADYGMNKSDGLDVTTDEVVPNTVQTPHHVRAVLRSKSTIPSLQDIAPYKQALVVYLYDLEEALPGMPQTKTVGVAHWGIRDGSTQLLTRQIGEIYDLTIVPYASHPELEGERVVMDFDQGTWPLYYEIGAKE